MISWLVPLTFYRKGHRKRGLDVFFKFTGVKNEREGYLL